MQVVQLVELANEIGEEMARATDWQALRTEFTFASMAQAEQTGAIPAYLRVGIAASTGGSTNVHEIKSLSISSLRLSNLVTTKTSTVMSDPVNGTTKPKAIPGAKVRYCIQVSNIAGNPTATSIVVTDPISSLPVTFVAGSIYLGGTVTGGVCNWNGTSGGTYSAGTVSGTIASLTAGAPATLYFDATVN